MIRRLVACALCAVAVALLALSPLGRQLERQIGLGLLYAARGDLPAPEGALVVGLDRASIGWLQRNIDALDRVSHGSRRVPPTAGAREPQPGAQHQPGAACPPRLPDPPSRRARAAPDRLRHQLQCGTARRRFLADAVRRAGNVLLLERIEEDGVARRLRPSAPLADAADADRVLPDRRISRKGRHRLSDAQPLLSDAYRPCRSKPGVVTPAGRRTAAQPDAGLPADLALRAGGHDSDRPDPARLRGGRVRASRGPLAAHRLRRRLRCVRPVRIRPLQGAADHGGVGCRGRRRARRNGLSQSGAPGADVRPAAARSGRSGLLLRLRSSLLASQFLGGGRALGGVLAIAVAYGATAVAVFVPCAALDAGRGAVDHRDAGRGALGILRAVRRCAPGRREAGAPPVRARTAEASGDRPRSLEHRGCHGHVRRHGRIDGAGGAARRGRVQEGDEPILFGRDRGGGGERRTWSWSTWATEFSPCSRRSWPGRTTPRRPASRRSRSRESPLRRPDGPDPEDRESFRLRFGIHSGSVVTGPTGAEHRYSFKALGDSVIVAARLEEHGKTLRQDGADIILLSAETRRRAALPDELLHPLGLTKLRGRLREVEIFRTDARIASSRVHERAGIGV